MKVLFVQDTLVNAGTEKSLMSILPHFSTDISVRVVYLYPRHDLLDDYTAANIPLNFLDLRGKYDFWNGGQRLIALFREEQPNLVVSSLLRSNLLCRVVCKYLNLPLVGTLVNDSYNNYRLEIKKGLLRQKFKFFWTLDRLTAGIPKLYISNSQFIASSHQLTLGIPLEKTRVVYRGRTIPERIWKKPTNSNYTFLSFGRLLQIKGFEELIQAFLMVHLDYPNSKLVIYGEGNHRKSLENLIERSGLGHAVQLPGINRNVVDELYAADCFVFPSWYEGFSGALVEAMISGIPIIASDIPMNLEAVTANENAIVFPVRNVQALAAKMNYAMRNPNDMALMGQKARIEAVGRFDVKVIAKQYEKVLTEVCQIHCKK